MTELSITDQTKLDDFLVKSASQYTGNKKKLRGQYKSVQDDLDANEIELETKIKEFQDINKTLRKIVNELQDTKIKKMGARDFLTSEILTELG